MADNNSDFRPHFVIGDSPDVLPYKDKGNPIKKPALPERDREAHGQSLLSALEEFDEKRVEIEQRRAKKGLAAKGNLLTFEFQRHPDLKPRNFENGQVGTQLLVYKELGDQQGVATVFVPEGKLRSFEKKFRQYIEEDTPKGNPKNQSFVANVEEIRQAHLEAIWTDPVEDSPPTGDERVWWEVWVRDEVSEEYFRDEARTLGLRVRERALSFPGRTIFVLLASPAEVIESIELLDTFAEVRRARPIAQEFLELRASDQKEWIDSLVERTSAPGEYAPAVCLLDTGLDHLHPLLTQAVSPSDVDACQPDWEPTDHNGHGTEMGGLAVYGDRLEEVLLGQMSVELQHCIESVKILPPGDRANDPDVYGEITKTAVAIAESNAPSRERAVSMSVTAESSPNGIPSSWSAAVDQICSGAEEGDDEDRPRRLFFVSAGNSACREEGYIHPDSNLTDPVQNPGQAWNAITVGAFTERVDIEPAADYPEWTPVATAGDMSPSNTTSFNWDKQWPEKPDIVMEGGNFGRPPDGSRISEIESLWLLTTKRSGIAQPFLTVTGETSAATSLAARMGAQIYAEYPHLWPETIRALLIHSARWTEEMKECFSSASRRERVRNLLSCFGYGVPDLDRALGCVGNEVSMVVEDTLQPYYKDSEKYSYKTKNMNLHRLPWPTEALDLLGDETVQLRATLSYFVEPNPAQRGWNTRYRYPSHGLRCTLPKAMESEDDFLRRVNPGLRPTGDKASYNSDADEWKLWDETNRGSVHSDVWEGSAVELLDRGMIAVTPVIGWWREYTSQKKFARKTRYSLVASIETESTEVDLYTEVEQRIEQSVRPQIQI